MFLGFVGSFMLALKALDDPAAERRLIAGCAGDEPAKAFPDTSRVVQVGAGRVLWGVSWGQLFWGSS